MLSMVGVESGLFLLKSYFSKENSHTICSITLLSIFLFTVFTEVAIYLVHSWALSYNQTDIELNERIRYLKRDSRHFEGPSDFSVGAKLNRQRNKLETQKMEARRIKTKIRSFGNNGILSMVPNDFKKRGLDFIILVPLVYIYWGCPLAPSPSIWMGPFSWVLSFPDVPKNTISVLAWFSLCRLFITIVRRLGVLTRITKFLRVSLSSLGFFYVR